PNGSPSSPNAAWRTIAPAGRGSTPAATTVNATPWIAATTFDQYRAGAVSRSQGRNALAATNKYRARPINSTQAPTVGAAYTLSTRIKNASTSMSNRAPPIVAEAVARATAPSTASSTSAAAANVTSSGDDN